MYEDHIRSMADRIERNGAGNITLGIDFVEACKFAWREFEQMRPAVLVIARAFPAQFPLIAERQAD
jgi:hypothetical protein